MSVCVCVCVCMVNSYDDGDVNVGDFFSREKAESPKSFRTRR